MICCDACGRVDGPRRQSGHCPPYNAPMPNRPPTHRPPGQQQAAQDARRAADRERADTEQRRLRNLRAYRRFAALVLLQRPTCEDCVERDDGIVRPATDVHHVRKLATHPEDLLDDSQVKALCHPCHSVRTARGE